MPKVMIMKQNRLLLFAITLLASFAGGGLKAADDVVIYGSVERSEAWVTASQYRTGFYSVSLTKDFQAVGETQKNPTVTDGAVYVDGYCYYLKKTYASVVRYSLDFCKMNTTTWQVEKTIAKSNGTLSLANDMTYDPVGRTVYAASPRSYGSRDVDLRTVDLSTGEFTTVAQLDKGIRTLAADSQGQLWGLGTEVVEGVTTTFLYRIDKVSGAVTTVGPVGLNMTEGETGMAFDLRDDRLYWTANYYEDDELLQRTYRSGLVELDTQTGRGTLLKAFSNNEKVVGMFINTDQPNGPANLTPKAPSNLQYSLSERDSRVTLSWTAPTLCEDGRSEIDPTTLTYTVVRLTDGRTLAEGLTQTTFTDEPPYQMQNSAYTVCAVTPGGTSAVARTANFIVGQAYNLPYLETFDRQANFNSYTVLDLNGDGDPQNSGGLWLWDYNNQEALYYTNFRYPNDWLITPTLNLPTDRVVRMRFGTHGYLGNGAVNRIEVTIGAAATAEAQDRTLLKVEYPSSQTALWQTALFVPREGDCRVGFHNVSNGSDHVSIDNIYFVDYGPLTIPAAPTEAVFAMDDEAAGVTLSVTAPTQDVAGNPLTDPLNIKVYRGGSTTPFYTFAGVLPGQTVQGVDNEVALGRNTYMFCASNADGDGLEMTATFENTHEEEPDEELEPQDPATLLPYVDDLHLETDGSLQWSDAVTYPALHPVTENVESLEAFSISGGQGWSTVDRDGARTVTIGTTAGNLNWPHATEAQGFIVFRPESINMQEYITPRSGDQCFVAFCAAGRANDDWLISPQLSGEGQTISFYAKCMFGDCLNERFEVWASGSDAELQSFVCVSGEKARAVTSDQQWQRFRFTLPQGTRYFAIRCVSDDQFGLMIDDLRYTPAYPAADLLGYNVYRDGEKQNATLVEDNLWQPQQNGRYQVSAVYLQGESQLSAEVEVTTNGIASPHATVGASAPMYRLDGVRTQQPRGLYIQQGKKEINKK